MATTRRELLVAGLGSTALLACRHGVAKPGGEHEGGEEEEEVTPAEDLMREHGVLRRVLTDRILAGATAAGLGDAATKASVLDAMHGFARMYRPHAAREDTVLFPALVTIIGEDEYEELGERFEAEEHRRFGTRGFFGVVDEVAAIEATLGIADLAAFTPTM